mmetsp:Transcript_124932/g.347851  ORF Transcript_124932/g.347851 Transcript_124932/m.347851 type:complete len:237 (-) Transcript_124932:190-900(-)
MNVGPPVVPSPTEPPTSEKPCAARCRSSRPEPSSSAVSSAAAQSSQRPRAARTPSKAKASVGPGGGTPAAAAVLLPSPGAPASRNKLPPSKRPRTLGCTGFEPLRPNQSTRSTACRKRTTPRAKASSPPCRVRSKVSKPSLPAWSSTRRRTSNPAPSGQATFQDHCRCTPTTSSTVSNRGSKSPQSQGQASKVGGTRSRNQASGASRAMASMGASMHCSGRPYRDFWPRAVKPRSW